VDRFDDAGSDPARRTVDEIVRLAPGDHALVAGLATGAPIRASR
jgi:hypothetical protein